MIPAANGSYSCSVVSGSVTRCQPSVAASTVAHPAAATPAPHGTTRHGARAARAGPAATRTAPTSTATATAGPPCPRQWPMTGAARIATPASATATVPHASATTTTTAHAATPTRAARASSVARPGRRPGPTGSATRTGTAMATAVGGAVVLGATRGDRTVVRGRGAPPGGHCFGPVRVGVPTVSRHDPLPDDPLVDVVFPVLDEAEALPWVLGRVPAGYRAIVVDNGSTDGSADIAQAAGATVVDEPRRGFGAACAAGLAAAEAPVVAFCDADASLDPSALPAVVGPVLAGEADLVLGAPPAHDPAGDAAARPRCQPVPGAPAAPCHRGAADRSGPDARRPPGRAGRRSASPTGASAGPSRWSCGRATPAGASPRCPSTTRPALGRSKVTGTVRGTARAVVDMRRVLADLG